TVFTDSNSNALFDAGDPREPGYIVQLLIGGSVVASTVTNAQGDYLFADFAPGTYSLLFIDPATNVGVGSIDNIVVADTDVIIDQDLPIDPSGVVYSSANGDPVAGAVLTLTNAAGTALPAACLLPNQQTQTTGASGAYRFDVVPGADILCPASETEYRIAMTVPATFEPVPSTSIPPQTGSLDATVCLFDISPGGSCALAYSDTPDHTAPPPYFMAFDLEPGDPDVVRNHIPVDPVPPVPADGLQLAKTASSTTARIGDILGYTLTLTNTLSDSAGPISLVDTLPPGFPYVPGSARLDDVAIRPVGNGNELTFANIVVPPSTAVDVSFNVRVSTSVTPGDYVNLAIGIDGTYGNSITNQARATVSVRAEPVFDCGEIIGKVFDDRNADGWQDEGEEGLGGIRLSTANGTLITTDEFGRYSVPCAALPDSDIGSNFIVKLDDRTLPTGYGVTTENPRVVRLTPGKLAKLNFGATRGSVVEFTVTGEAFIPNSAAISPALANGIGQLADGAVGGPTRVRVTYLADQRDGQRLPKARLAEVETAVRQRFAMVGIRQELEFEPIVVRP
ncbi:MAG: SdrD B-like domain-containing protein, partial [Pseudomonadota bacterium]